jgi:hypothetical protein
MSNKMVLSGVAGIALMMLAAPADAEEDLHKPEIYSVYGASFSVGGGVVGFTDDAVRDFSNSVGGAWDARLVYGTRTDVAVEAAYTGGAVGLDALGLDNNATLISSGVEVLGRVNLLKEQWQPYLMAGIGWRHYSIVNTDQNTSSVDDAEDLGEVPMGGGVSYRYEGLVVDARALFRAAFNDEMIDRSATDEEANLHSWQAQVTAGWEF